MGAGDSESASRWVSKLERFPALEVEAGAARVAVSLLPEPHPARQGFQGRSNLSALGRIFLETERCKRIEASGRR